jgi:hypothetical protein
MIISLVWQAVGPNRIPLPPATMAAATIYDADLTIPNVNMRR